MVDNNEVYEDFMDLEGVADRLKVSVRTVHRYIKDPDNPLPTFMITGRTIRVKREDLDAWLESYRKENND